jgi:hypothetical protein
MLIHRPLLILKDRPYLNESLEADLGEIIITSKQRIETGRLKTAPLKQAFMNTMVIDAKDLGIKYNVD